SIACEHGLCVRSIRRLAQEEKDLHGLTRRELERSLQGAARIEAGAYTSGQGSAPGEGGRPVERAMASEKLAPISGPLRLPSGQIRERHTRAELGAPRVAREHGSRVGIDGRQHE